MNRILKTPLISAFALALVAGWTSPALAETPDFHVAPDADLGPADVVTIQMQALGNNDEPFDGAGIEITFRFASPTNRSVTGPLDRFSTLFDGPAYGPMLNHNLLEIGIADVSGDQARVPVFIESPDGTRLAYVFLLGRQPEDSECGRCWLTDSVFLIGATVPDRASL